jgi:hypothetical protein
MVQVKPIELIGVVFANAGRAKEPMITTEKAKSQGVIFRKTSPSPY